MNDIFELWSLPWHALQRSLADTFGNEANATLAASLSSSNSRRLRAAAGAPVAAGAPAGASSWLVRARSGVTQAPSAGY
jgi:hypothetical protein